MDTPPAATASMAKYQVWLGLLLVFFVFVGASRPAAAVPLGAGDTVSMSFDLSSSTIGTSEHLFQIEFLDTTPASGNYSISWGIVAASGFLFSSPEFEIMGGGGSPGPLTQAVTISSILDLSGTISASILYGPGGLGNLTGAIISVSDGDGNPVGSQFISEESFTIISVPEPASLALLGLGLFGLGLYRRKKVQ